MYTHTYYLLPYQCSVFFSRLGKLAQGLSKKQILDEISCSGDNAQGVGRLRHVQARDLNNILDGLKKGSAKSSFKLTSLNHLDSVQLLNVSF